MKSTLVVVSCHLCEKHKSLHFENAAPFKLFKDDSVYKLLSHQIYSCYVTGCNDDAIGFTNIVLAA